MSGNVPHRNCQQLGMRGPVNNNGQIRRRRAVRLGVTGVVTALALAVQACGSATAHGSADGQAAAAPAKAGATTSRFFGMHVPQLATAFPKAKVGAVNLTTNNVYWPNLETAPGTWDFTHLDALVSQARRHGAQPLLVLGQTPAFYSQSPSSPQVWATVPDLAPWKAYVQKVVDRYGTKLDYEIWPEANIVSNWAGNQSQLAARVAAAAKIIHARAPRATVVSPAMVLRLAYERRWMDKFFAQKVGGKLIGKSFDAIGLDPYPTVTGSPEDSMSLIGKARRILASHKVTAPQWNVEINYGVVGGNTPITGHSSARKQASYVVRTYVLNAGARIKRVYWLGWARFDSLDIQMVETDGVTPSAAGRAYSRVQKWLTGQKVTGCQQARHSHVYTCTLRRSGRTSWVYWVPSGRTSVPAPAGARHVQSMTGVVSRTHHGKRIRVTNAPVWVYN
jgi:polysaccharide biosynthesis protein PslG